ncbi:MAG: ribosome-associated translation inhibitor RaiA [Syntrophomonas sp.]|nr:ribosome-associated translation inhibitor RaiA [Syntrophomonas sp.]
MRLDIRGRNIEITDALKDYTTKRLSKLEKYIDDARIAQVALSLEGEDHKVEVTIPLSGLILRGEVSAEDMYSAIDMVVEKLEKQIEKHKTKLYRRHRGAGLKQLALDEAKQAAMEREAAEKFPIVKTKRFALKPMDEEEAIMQMALLGHNFFMFHNANTGDINVVYKRLDGDFGLIEPYFD